MFKFGRKGSKEEEASQDHRGSFRRYGLLAASMALGLGIGFGVRSFTKTEKKPAPVVQACPETRIIKQNTDDFVNDMVFLSAYLNRKLADSPQDQKSIQSALNSLDLITKSPKFDMKKLNLIKELIERTDRNSGNAIGLLWNMINKESFHSTDLDERFVSKIIEIVKTTAANSGDSAQEALNNMQLISAVNFKKNVYGSPVEEILTTGHEDTLDAFKAIVDRNRGRNVADVLDMLGTILGRGDYHPRFLGKEMADRLCDSTDILIKETGDLSGKAFKDLQKCLRQHNNIPWVALSHLKVISENSKDRGMFMDVLAIMRGRAVHFHYNPHSNPDFVDNDTIKELCMTLELVGKKAGNGLKRKAFEDMEYLTSTKSYQSSTLALIRLTIENAYGKEVIRRIEGIEKYSSMDILSKKNYEDGKRLAVLLLKDRNPGTSTIAHFAYGMFYLGEEKVRKMFAMFGVRFFLRYREKAIEEIGKNLDPGYTSKKPILISVAAKSDWNDAFGVLELNELLRYYKVLPVETRKKSDVSRYLSGICKTFGKIDTLMIHGHGTPDSINLGDSSDEQSINDYDEGLFRGLRNCFVQNPTVILESCSTGKDWESVGAMISKVLGARVFAPTRVASGIRLKLNDEGRIIDAWTDVPVREFWKGRSRLIPAEVYNSWPKKKR